MEFPFGHHHHHHHRRRSSGDSDEDRPDLYPPPGTTIPRPFYDQPPPPQPPPFGGAFYQPPTSYPPPMAAYPPPPPATQHYPPYQTHQPPAVEHVAHQTSQTHHSYYPHLPSFPHHHAQHQPGGGAAVPAELATKPTFKVYCKADPNFALTIRDEKVILARVNPNDPYQHWYKDEKYSTRVKDEEGFPCFALVNKATGLAMKHSFGASHPQDMGLAGGEWSWDGYTSQCIWNEVSRNEDDLSYMFDETTPVKDCADPAFEVMGNGLVGETSKEIGEPKESSLQVKRRRMLQFDSHATDPSFRCEESSSAFLKLVGCGTNDSSEGICSDLSSWISAETADDFPDGWLSQCLTDPDMNCSPDDVNNLGDSDVLIDVSENWNDPPNQENRSIPPQVVRTPQKVVFKGRRSYIRTPSRLACSIAYPFDFVKPCGVRGDVTLKDINQRIRTPPPPKMKQSSKDSSPAYPTSAFSGKPVVGKTKIRTEGGKGSITITRTKG